MSWLFVLEIEKMPFRDKIRIQYDLVFKKLFYILRLRLSSKNI